jgi:tRNA pseudouridine55 synthase
LRESEAGGILNVDKPAGQSSHDVVERVRSLTHVRRVGHAGTLDPLATGVLVVCVGRTATRVVEYLMGDTKSYRTDIRLGVVTDTFDAEGEVIARSPVDVDRNSFERALGYFRGTIEQVPPMYSAVKHQGKPLYRLARQGIEVERKPRRVEVERLDLVAWEPHGRCTLEIVCSHGTYVRVLVHDLGQKLGCGAYVTGLTRLASGSFRLENAVTLEQFAQAARDGCWTDLLQSVDEALADKFPALHLGASEARRLCSGQSLPNGKRLAGDTTLARVYGPRGRFIALAAHEPQEGVWRPKKVFVSPYPDSEALSGG